MSSHSALSGAAMLIRSRFYPFSSRRRFLRKPFHFRSCPGFLLVLSVIISLAVVFVGFHDFSFVSTTLGSGYRDWKPPSLYHRQHSFSYLPISDLENSEKFWNISQRQDQYAITA